jgi:hypothetical protein
MVWQFLGMKAADYDPATAGVKQAHADLPGGRKLGGRIA